MKRIIGVRKRRKPRLYSSIDWEKAKVIFDNSTEKPVQTQNTPTSREILSFLAVVGAVGLAFAFPQSAKHLGPVIIGKLSYPRWKTRKKLLELKAQRYIRVRKDEHGKTAVIITKRGLEKALTYKLEELKINRMRKWDYKWRVVIFDIPERYKRTRDLFRMRLVQMGMHQLQESVYVSPYKCFDEIEFLRQLYAVTFTVKYLICEKIENDSGLKIHFGLDA